MEERTWIQRYIAPLVTAPGADRLRDDVAVLSVTGPTIATMDTLVEGIHFLSPDPLHTVGQKLIRVNVSDILAKGATPAEALLSVAWPRERPEADFADLVRGIGKDLEDLCVHLIGGDLVTTDGPMTLTLTLTGTCINEGPVRRTGGRVGDKLWVNGEIGWGGLGLEAAKTGGDPEIASRYRVPRISGLADAQTVAELASASMDVSDGLLLDVSQLAAASECGARIALDRVPLAAPTDALAGVLTQCTSGDDYRILLSAPSEQVIPGYSCIGELISSPGLELTHGGQFVNAPSTLGFEH